MAEEKTQMVQNYDWSWAYLINKIAYDIAIAEGKHLQQLKRTEYLALIREVVNALGGAEKGSIEGSRFSR